ncbi:enoyl-CoA hydratase/isomerase family protein [Nocardia sp. NPDC059091]|uniref:enoyl-CoA hydratase/isomerase family protein n=1 Tax=unclassified Nocardia TaxID=2637762 RepID=UPI0036892AB6
MAFDGYSTLRATGGNGVLRVVLDNPPVNVLGAVMMRELQDLLAAVRADSEVRVIVFESANPEFFLAHVDIQVADRMDILRDLAASAPEETAGLGQVEALMGITPGGGGTQYLRERVGRNRALEIVLTGDLVDARTAASIGWINRAIPAAHLDTYVSDVASKIAALPDGVIAAAKKALPPTEFGPGLIVENDAWAGLVDQPAAQRIMGTALTSGAQTPDGERDLEQLLRGIADAERSAFSSAPRP